MMKPYSKYINPYIDKILNNKIEHCPEQRQMIDNIVIPVLDREDVIIDDMKIEQCLSLQKYFPYMKENGFGRILTVGSVQQYRPHKDMAVYAATKEAQMSLVKNIAKQVAAYGITVNNLCPGVIATPRNDEALSNDEYRQKVLSGIPAGYAGEADDCAYAALYLCSNEARYVTGSEIIVDGGMHL